MLKNLRSLGSSFTISLPQDTDGFTGRECPVNQCEGYFKIELGTGLKGENLPCHCPYCGHTSSHNDFYTKEQIKYAKSVALNRITTAVLKDLKSLEFNHRPRPGHFDIGISMTVQGRPHPVRYFREKTLETEVVCEHCTLRYAIYGVFAFCPDCGTHNSLQILEKNLELAEKELNLAVSGEHELEEFLIRDALENAVATFDGFGRETCRICAKNATVPEKASHLSFQNLKKAQQNVQQLFRFDIATAVNTDTWNFVCRSFQKRHLLAHQMGVIDQAYVDATQDLGAIVGRKVSISVEEVRRLIAALNSLGSFFVQQLATKS